MYSMYADKRLGPKFSDGAIYSHFSLIKILNKLTFKPGFFNENWASTFLSCCWTYFSIHQIFYPAMEN